MFISPLANLIVNILVNSRNAQLQLGQIHGQLNRTAVVARNFGSYFVATAAIAALSEYVKKLEEVETGFIRIERVAKEFKGPGFREDIFDLAGDISGTSLTELQKVMKISAQLGIRGTENLKEFSKQVATLQNITGLGDELTSDVGKILQVFDLAPTEAEKLINTILQVSDDFNVLETEITNIVRRIGAFAKSIGLSADETIAFAGAMKDVGVNTEIAASSLYTFFARLQTNPFKLGRALGMDDAQIEAMFVKLRQEPKEAILDILEHLKKLPPSIRLGVFKELELYGVRNAAALGTLAEKTDRLREAFASASKGLSENTKLLEGQFEVANSLRGKIDDLSDAWTRFIFTASETGVIKGTFDFLSNYLDELTRKIRIMQGLSESSGNVDFANPQSIVNEINRLESDIKKRGSFVKGGPSGGKELSELIFGKKEKGIPRPDWQIELGERAKGVRQSAVNIFTSQKQDLAKLAKLRQLLERRLAIEDMREKGLTPPKLGAKEPPPLPEIMREFNQLKQQDKEKEKKKSEREPAFKGFMDLTEAFKNRILDMQDDEKAKIKKLNEIWKEGVEQNDHLEEAVSILRTRSFPAVLV